MSKKPRVAIAGMGAMGSALARRLVENGIEVVTPKGRSAHSETRAEAAGVRLIELDELGEVDFFFSIAPSDAAESVARTYTLALAGRERQPVYVDWNATSINTLSAVRGIVEAAGLPFADGGIIGMPPRNEGAGPALYVCGAPAHLLAALEGRGLRLVILDEPIGAASSLKLCYAGITKGLIGLGATMLLAAERNGCAEALIAELKSSQASLASSLGRSIPDMLPKAARWVPEMHEISAIAEAETGGEGIYGGIANLYEALSGRREDLRERLGSLATLLIA